MNAHLTTLVLFLGVLNPLLADWPQWRGPQRDGVDVESPDLIREISETGIKPVWLNRECVAEGRGEGWSSPIVGGDRVYFFGHSNGKKQESLCCLEAGSGKEVWRKTFPSKAAKYQQSSTPALEHDRLFVLGAGRIVRCLDAGSADELWKRQLPGEDNDEPWHSSPLVVDGKVIVFAGRLLGLSAESGEVLWQGDDVVKEGVHGSPALAQFSNAKIVIAHVGGGETVAVDPDTGSQRWRVKTEATASTPVIHDGRMVTLAQSRKGGVRCYRISDSKAELLWKCQTIADPGASPVIVGDYVYVQGEKKLVCLRLEDGKETWKTELNVKEPRYTSLIAAAGQVFYAFDSLLCFAAEPDDFQQLYHARFDREGLLSEQVEAQDCGPHACTSPAISQGRLYLRLKQGIACYDLRK